MSARACAIPRKRSLVLRLLVIFLAVALAVGLQAGEGQAAGHRDSVPASAPTTQAVGCAPQVSLKHPALPVPAQPSEARSSDASSGCSRPALSDS